MTSTDPARVVLVGAGRVGTSVALFLKDAGLAVVGVSSRTSRSRREAAQRLRCDEFDYRAELPESDIVLIGAGDAALEEVARELAPRVRPNTYVCHFSGSVGTRPLAPVGQAGARPCALHPVQAFPDIDAGLARLGGSAWAVTCDEADLLWAESFVERFLQGRPVRVSEQDRPIWHAAAVMVSNGIAALLSVGESMLGSIDVSAPDSVLGPIASATVSNAGERGGGGATLTGPVVRGESFVIERHVAALAGGELLSAYAQVVEMIVAAAQAADRIEAEVAAEMLKVVTPR